MCIRDSTSTTRHEHTLVPAYQYNASDPVETSITVWGWLRGIILTTAPSYQPSHPLSLSISQIWAGKLGQHFKPTLGSCDNRIVNVASADVWAYRTDTTIHTITIPMQCKLCVTMRPIPFCVCNINSESHMHVQASTRACVHTHTHTHRGAERESEKQNRN